MISILIFDFSTGIRIAAPTAVLASMYNAGRKGILVKNGACLERLAQTTAIVFDKTGTLTMGEPHVTQVIQLPVNYDEDSAERGAGAADARYISYAERKPKRKIYESRAKQSADTHVRAKDEASAAPNKIYTVDEIIAMAAAVEQRHHHPASRAILKYAAHKQITVDERSQSCHVAGMGVKAKIADCIVAVGSRQLMESEEISTAPAIDYETQLAAAGQSLAYVSANGKLIGLIAYSDQIRPEAAQTIYQLRKLGLQRIVMATGDGEVVAKHIAELCGINEYKAKVFPDQKVELVKQLKAQGHTVAVIGDGINDSPALAHADVAFSLHGCTEAAREGADIVLTDGDLRRLPEAIRIARGAINLVKGNLTLAVIPNSIGLGMAALGMVGPAGATLLNNGSAIVCGLNSLRPLYSDPWSKAELITRDK